LSDDYRELVSRRRLLAAAGGVAIVPVAGGWMQVAGSAVGVAPASATAPGTPAGALGARAPGEAPARRAFGPVSFTPLQDLHGTITPSDLHFERHHAGIPAIDAAGHELVVHGMVDRPLKFSVADLKRFPATTRICFIECSGNLNIRAGEQTTPQMLAGLTSQSEWTGVRLSTIFREVGVSAKARWFLAEGADAALMSRSIPVEKGFEDALLAYAQNGEALRPAQGYPLRLLLPGWEGNTSVKWLRRIELADRPFMTREETSKYTEPLKDGTVRQFSFVMDARSVITFPAYPVTLQPGWVEIRGLAWSGRGRVRAVEVTTDGGRSWRLAELQEPVLPQAHTRFTAHWNWDGKPAEIASRAVDETGYRQPDREQLIAARGRGAVPYHLNPVTAWRIAPGGQVTYRTETW
jgi:sulfane dehydrogenase subunit SoxC